MTESPETGSREEETPRQGAEGEKDPTGGAGAGPEEGVEFGEGKGPGGADAPAEPNITPGPGGYQGRDPKTDMPKIPSVPETQDDPKSHDAAPSDKTPEPPASN